MQRQNHRYLSLNLWIFQVPEAIFQVTRAVASVAGAAANRAGVVVSVIILRSYVLEFHFLLLQFIFCRWMIDFYTFLCSLCLNFAPFCLLRLSKLRISYVMDLIVTKYISYFGRYSFSYENTGVLFDFCFFRAPIILM